MSGLVSYGNDLVRIISGADTPNVKEWTFDSDGNIMLPFGGNLLDHDGNIIISEGTGNITFDFNTIKNSGSFNPVIIRAGDNYDWVFNPGGALTLPPLGLLVQSNSITKTRWSNVESPSLTVVWASSSAILCSAKLLIQVEQQQVGDPTGYHTHSCEAIISARGGTQTDVPNMTVYGITYTSTGPLATFTVQRNISTGIVEVVALVSDATNPAYVSIHSVETESRVVV